MTLPLPEDMTRVPVDERRLNITPGAVDNARKKVLEAEEPVYGLRVGVRGGGCAGYSYVIEYATKVKPKRDMVYDYDGVDIIVDKKSIEILDGATLDFERRLMGYGFKWINPNAKNDCGCGESFDV